MNAAGRRVGASLRTLLLRLCLRWCRAAVAACHGRPSGPHCRGGVSSLLRLSQAGAARLPNAQDLASWIQRAGSALGDAAA